MRDDDLKAARIVPKTARSDPISRRRRITDRQAHTWLRSIEGGASTAEVASDAGVQARTIRKYVDRARLDAAFQAAQADRLRAALGQHHDDLLGTATQVREALRWPPYSLRGNRVGGNKPVEALLAHLGGSRVPHGIRAWDAVGKDYTDLSRRLDERLLNNVAEASAPAMHQEGALLRLRNLADSAVHGGTPHAFTYAVEGDSLRSGAYSVAVHVDSLEDPRAASVLEFLEMTAQALTTWDEIRALVRLKARVDRLAAELSEELEDLALRRYVPGRCRWCPGTPTVKRSLKRLS
jgi:hypothetical protein